MSEKAEWEVVGDETDETQPHARPTARQLLIAMLGPYWRWKLAGFVILTGITLAFLVAFVGIMVLVLSAAALVLFTATRIRRWLQRGAEPHLPKNR